MGFWKEDIDHKVEKKPLISLESAILVKSYRWMQEVRFIDDSEDKMNTEVTRPLTQKFG